MKRCPVRAAAAAAALLCGQAWASVPQPGAGLTLPPDRIALAKAEADRLIADAGAAAYFVNITDSAVPRVRHIASGMECAFTPNQKPNAIRIYASSAKPGQDVSCQTAVRYVDGGWALDTLYASLYPDPLTLEEQMSAMVEALKRRAQAIEPAAGAFQAAGDAPAHDAARYQATHGPGEVLFERAAAGVIGRWDISQRITAPIDEAQPADADGERALAAVLEEVQAASTR